MRNLRNALDFVIEKFDVFSHYNVDRYLYGNGLCVHADYRGRGIATKLLEARLSLLKALDLRVTSTLFTTLKSQKAAKSAGYDEVSSTSYEELQLRFEELDFSQSNASHCKTFVLEN